MKFAWIFATLYLLNGFGPSVVNSTCVLESDFGIILNCAFKKSGLFRVRNLGGVKAHVGLGFSVGDELGFNESLSNLEGNKRRSSSGRVAQTAQKRDNRIVVQNVQNPPTKVKTDRSVQSSNAIISTTPPVIRKKVTSGTTTPPFKPLPPALDPKLIIGSAAIKPTVPKNTSNKQTIDPIPEFHAMPASVVNAYTSAQLSNEKIPTEAKVNHLSANNLLQRVMTTNSSDLNQNGLSAAELDIIARKEALKRKQALIAAQKAADALTSTTTTTTQAPLTTKINPVRSGVAATANKHYSTTSSKVMNAPKEYYPVGYDKNFDDNFVSRVELPETSFYCGDQKHFPGLYADEDLGCMVFHVCALTDDGLIMKSFLCPESTLFDQTILKCNWWFYVDCKNSKSLYDSNIPISKSYQLMKALTFFSSIKKDSSEKN